MDTEYPLKSTVSTPWDSPSVLLNKLLDPIAALDDTSLKDTAGNLTSWDNIAKGASNGGSGYNLMPSFGTITIGKEQGKRVAVGDGASNLKPTALKTVAQPVTLIVAARNATDAPATLKELFSGRNNTTALRINHHSSNQWRALAGTAINVTATDADFNIHLVVANGGSSSYTVINTAEGSDSGAIGANAVQWCTLFSQATNASFFDGPIGGVWLFGKAFTDQELSMAMNASKDKWMPGRN